MGYELVERLVGSFGFPIVMCLIMAWFINNTQKELIKAINSLTKINKAILTKLKIQEDDENEE